MSTKQAHIDNETNKRNFIIVAQVCGIGALILGLQPLTPEVVSKRLITFLVIASFIYTLPLFFKQLYKYITNPDSRHEIKPVATTKQIWWLGICNLILLAVIIAKTGGFGTSPFTSLIFVIPSIVALLELRDKMFFVVYFLLCSCIFYITMLSNFQLANGIEDKLASRYMVLFSESTKIVLICSAFAIAIQICRFLCHKEHDRHLMSLFRVMFRSTYGKQMTDIGKRMCLFNGTKEEFRNSKNTVAMLPFCIKPPNCTIGRKEQCFNFGGDPINDTCEFCTAREIHNTLKEYGIEAIFNVRSSDVKENLKKCNDENLIENAIDSLIVACCPKDLIAIKEEICVPLIDKYSAGTLVYVLDNYEGCIFNNESRNFAGQAKIDLYEFFTQLSILKRGATRKPHNIGRLLATLRQTRQPFNKALNRCKNAWKIIEITIKRKSIEKTKNKK